MKTVGLTGGIATGKSTVGKILRDELHLPVIDADRVSREVTTPGRPAHRRIIEAFGEAVLDAEGQIDRQRLGAIVMRDPERRRQLEAITHPAIRDEIQSRLQALEQSGAQVAVVEAALMVETGSWRLYDRLLVVSCSPETQLRRLVERDGHPEAEARRWIASQLPLVEKEKLASAVIWNEGDLSALRAATNAAWSSLDL